MRSKKFNRKRIRINESLAEFYGAMIGDGCLSRYYPSDRNAPIEVVQLSGHLINDIHYYENKILQILIKEFGTRGRLQKREKYNSVLYWVTNKLAFSFFEDLGFPVGKKIRLNIPRGILADNKKAIACVKGIFNTDGAVYRRYSKRYKNHARFYNYLVIQFKLNSQRITKQVKKILNNNNIRTNKISRDKKCYVLRITNQEDIHKFMQIIRTSNKYHIERYLNLGQNLV